MPLGRPPHGGADRNRLTAKLESCFAALGSPPARGRGSKHPGWRRRAALLGSPPARGRGSKHPRPAARHPPAGRPPHGGADRNKTHLDETGAKLSPPARGRGSKLAARYERAAPWRVAPRTGARIETLHGDGGAIRPGSPPARGRGSKPRPAPAAIAQSWSPPARGRGSKPHDGGTMTDRIEVAPRTGARIETAA